MYPKVETPLSTMADDSIFNHPKLKIPIERIPISGPIFDGDGPETLHKGLYSTDKLPGLYAA
jgi:hypothetical protein